MGLPSMTPVVGILDDCDRPEADMLVIVYGNPACPSVEYLNPRVRPMALRGRMAGYPSRFVHLEAFEMYGFFEEDGMFQVRADAYGAQTALYPDGEPRPWQGLAIDAVDVRPQMMGHLMKAVRAMRQRRHAAM